MGFRWNILWVAGDRVSGLAQIHWAVALVVVQGLLAIPGWVISIPVAMQVTPAVATAQDGAQRSDGVIPVDGSVRLDQLLTNLVLENLPHDYVDDKKWGRQSERWDGVDVQFKDGKIRTHRRWKKVNHGTWKRYTVSLMNPDEEFAVRVTNMRQRPDASMAFDVECSAHVKLHGRQSKWVKGVQMYSLSADGHARLNLSVSMQLKTHLDITKFPPDLIFEPIATAANIDIQELRIDRISKAGGEFAQQVSKGVRGSLDEKIAQKEQKLVEKINKKLLEEKKSLRLSISEAAKSKWASAAKTFLPESVRGALGE